MGVWVANDTPEEAAGLATEGAAEATAGAGAAGLEAGPAMEDPLALLAGVADDSLRSAAGAVTKSSELTWSGNNRAPVLALCRQNRCSCVAGLS